MHALPSNQRTHCIEEPGVLGSREDSERTTKLRSLDKTIQLLCPAGEQNGMNNFTGFSHSTLICSGVKVITKAVTIQDSIVLTDAPI